MAETNITNIPRAFLPRRFMVVHSNDGQTLGGIGVPNKNRFRQRGASLNPARASLHVPFYWKGDLVPRFRRERDHWHIGAGTPNTSTALRRPRKPFWVAWAGRRIYAGFGTIGAFQS